MKPWAACRKLGPADVWMSAEVEMGLQVSADTRSSPALVIGGEGLTFARCRGNLPRVENIAKLHGGSAAQLTGWAP